MRKSIDILYTNDGNIHKNYLGSYDAISNNVGDVEERLSFDPWGRRRNPDTGIVDDGIYSVFDRGFTGHEHLDVFGLINMNGRVYDPRLARFLSPDPFVQAPDMLQNHNRYSYALNNPLRYTDPSGEWIHIAIGAFVGGVVNWATNGAQFNAAGLGYFGVGALAGGLAAGIGAGIGGLVSGAGSFSFSVSSSLSQMGFWAGAAVGGSAGITNGFISGTGNSLVGGKNIGESLGRGLDAAWKQGLAGAAIGGAIAGISALKHGRTFWTGTRKGSMYVSAERLSINVPEQRAELSIGSNSPELKPFYVDSELTYDGNYLNWYDNYSDGSSRLRFELLSRSGGKSQLPANVRFGITPNGDYIVNNLRLRELNQNTLGFFTNDGFGFTVDLTPQFTTPREFLRIHFDNTCSWGTGGCIGIVHPNDAHIFYNSIQKYFSRISDNIGLWVNQ